MKSLIIELTTWWYHPDHIYPVPDLPSTEQHSVSTYHSLVQVVNFFFPIKLDFAMVALTLNLSSHLFIWQVEEELSVKASWSS